VPSGGPIDGLTVAVRLAAQHRAPFLVVSQGTPASRDPCPKRWSRSPPRTRAPDCERNAVSPARFTW
jgi:hypothetical protein